MKIPRHLKALGLAILAGAFLWFLICLLLYRLPGEVSPRYFNGNVQYKYFDLGGSDNRLFFESLLGNVPARLVDNTMFYVSKSDKKLLWPPSELNGNRYTSRAHLVAQPLLFGGIGPARILKIQRIEEEPRISK